MLQTWGKDPSFSARGSCPFGATSVSQRFGGAPRVPCLSTADLGVREPRLHQRFDGFSHLMSMGAPRFNSDPDEGGAEKLFVSDVSAYASMLEKPYDPVQLLYPDMLPPYSVGYVKGWRRATTLLAVLAAIKALEIPKDQLPKNFLRKAGTIHATVHGGSLREQCLENRRITLAATSTRKAPNAFHFLRQAEILAKLGHGNAQQQFEDAWSPSTKFQNGAHN